MIQGFFAIGRALSLLRRNPRLLLLLMVAPWTINLILFLGGWSLLTVWLTGQVDPYLEQLVDGWWQNLLVGFGNFIAVVVAGGLAYVVTVIGAVVVAAPFHDRLSAASERAAAIIPGEGGRTMGWLAALKEGAKTALLLILVELCMLPLLLLPVLGHALFAVGSAVVLTLGLLDVPLARHELTLAQKRRFVLRRSGGVFGLSMAVLAVSMIPFLNLLTLPLVVMAVTLLVAEHEARVVEN